MRKTLLAAALLASLAACQKGEAPVAAAGADTAAATADTSKADAAFADLSRRALEGWLQLSPVGAQHVPPHGADRHSLALPNRRIHGPHLASLSSLT